MDERKLVIEVNENGEIYTEVDGSSNKVYYSSIEDLMKTLAVLVEDVIN